MYNLRKTQNFEESQTRDIEIEVKLGNLGWWLSHDFCFESHVIIYT